MPRTRTELTLPPKALSTKNRKRSISPSRRTQSTKRARVEPAQPAPALNRTPAAPKAARQAPHLFVWGASDSGQLGLGEHHVAEVSKPRRHPWVEQQMTEGTLGAGCGAGVISVASGGLHTYILDERGSVWSCGTNDEGALGRGVKKTPRDESLAKAQEFGVLKSLVDDNFRVVQMVAGDNFGAVLNEKGNLKVWGTFRQDDGSSMFSSGVTKQLLPVSVLDLGRKAGVAETVSSIAGGENHLLALTTHGDVYSWGVGESGQLGRRVLSRHKQDALVPQRVILGARSRKAVVIGTGLRTGFAVDTAGDVWGWGLNSRGQIGTGFAGEIISQPTKIACLSRSNLPGGARIVQICGGEWHTLFLTSSGAVYACGACNDFQLGLPDDHEVFKGLGCKDAGSVASPVLVPFPDGLQDPIVVISSGPRYNMAVTKAGVLYSWGVGLQGELGLGEGVEAAATPQVVVRKDGSWAATSVSCGGQHAMGLFKKRKN
ncbi:hypothetical protein AX16_005348 [Volvariella volvacea WC 439]|nr:hypothetical protein AX16_005348 [Volvariella volvacea WC 439]